MAKLPVRSATNDKNIWHLFGPPPLLKGEDRAAFEKLLSQFSADEKPTDAIEHAWVWDITVLTWEINRYRRSIAGLNATNTVRGLKVVLEPLYGIENSQALLDRWVQRDPKAIQFVDGLLEVGGLSMEDVAAQTLSVIISDIERIDGIITRMEARRNSVLREIERHRATLGAALRRSVGEIEEGQFTEIGAPGRKMTSAA
jgi:hypothetical protein